MGSDHAPRHSSTVETKVVTLQHLSSFVSLYSNILSLSLSLSTPHCPLHLCSPTVKIPSPSPPLQPHPHTPRSPLYPSHYHLPTHSPYSPYLALLLLPFSYPPTPHQPHIITLLLSPPHPFTLSLSLTTPSPSHSLTPSPSHLTSHHHPLTPSPSHLTSPHIITPSPPHPFTLSPYITSSPPHPLTPSPSHLTSPHIITLPPSPHITSSLPHPLTPSPSHFTSSPSPPSPLRPHPLTSSHHHPPPPHPSHPRTLALSHHLWFLLQLWECIALCGGKNERYHGNRICYASMGHRVLPKFGKKVHHEVNPPQAQVVLWGASSMTNASPQV